MNCVLRRCVYMLIGLTLPVFAASAKDDINTAINPKDHFQWEEHTKLSWDDFKGAVHAAHSESAAATYCSIGFKTIMKDDKPEIMVYNTFYTNQSWVRPDAKIQSILDHEQGHFDLCEIYTRKLRQRMSNFNLSSQGAKQALMLIYNKLSQEYEIRQQAYEQQTVHGTNIAEQKRWQAMIANELTPRNI